MSEVVGPPDNSAVPAPGAPGATPGDATPEDASSGDGSEYNRLVALVVVVIFAAAALIVLLGEDRRRAVSLEPLPRCPAAGVPATAAGSEPAPCVEVVPVEVVRQAYGKRQEKGGVRQTKTVELRRLSDGSLLVAHPRSELFWRKFDQGGRAEVALFDGKVIQVRYQGQSGDTLDNPLIRGRRNLIFIAALALAGVLVGFDLKRRRGARAASSPAPDPSAASQPDGGARS
jgi:hypothetical protein